MGERFIATEEQRLCLLGPPRLWRAGSWLSLAADKRHQLLAYLAYRGDWVRRDALAFQFWPDMPESTARHALRQLLKRTRRLAWLAGLEVEPDRLRWEVVTDVADFTAALAAGDAVRAVGLYAGPLLEGLDAAVTGELASWLEVERQRLHGRWRDAALVGAEALAPASPNTAAELLGLVLERDPFDEQALRAQMTVLASAGRHRDALRSYRGFAERLQAELDMQPTTDTDSLAEAISRGAVARTDATLGEAAAGSLGAVAGSPLTPPGSLPRSTTSFVGRAAELAQLHRLLADPESRLVNITGLGGAGKSRLAVQGAGNAAELFPDGTFHVALEHVAAAEQVAAAVAAAVGVDMPPALDPYPRLTARLGRGRVLLVLDNFEHLTAAAGLLVSLLRDCPELKLLVTSRVPLGLGEEWLLPLTGLSLPEEGAERAEALHADAVRLLVERGRRVAPWLTLDAALLPHAVRLCRALGGSPLAIELATVWARRLPLEQLATELERSLDLLVASNGGADERHASVRAIFEQSWRLLKGAERAALTRMAVFQGGFTAEAAALVAEASNAVLGSLVDKALLHVSRLGRYDLHPLVRQFTRERQATEENAADEHARYFLALAEQAVRNDERGPGRGVVDLAPELANLHVALEHLVRTGAPALQLRLAVALGRHYLERGPYGSGATVLAEALAASREPRHERLQALLLAGQLAQRRGHKQEAFEYLKEARRLATSAGDPQAHAAALTALARSQLQQAGGAAEAEVSVHEALRLSRQHGARRAEADALFTLATIERETGRMADSIERLTEAHALFVALDDAAGAASCLKNLGNRYLDQGDTGLARAAYEAALEAYEAVGNRLGRGMVFDCLGLVAAREGDHAEATRLHGLSSALYREQGDLALLAPSLTFLARARLASGDVPAASSLLDESIALQLKLGNRRHLADAVRTRGDVAVIMGDQRAASHYRRSLTLSREEGDAWGAVQALIGLGGCHLDVGELAEAERVWREALPLARDMRLGSEVALVLEGLAQVALGRGDETYAARLAATAAGARAAVGGDESAVGRLRRERFTALLGKLGRGAQTTGAAAPQPLDLDELVVALKETNPFSASARPLRPAGRRQRS